MAHAGLDRKLGREEADPAADGVKLVEPLVNAHVAIIPPGRDAVGRVPVPGTGTNL
jgi:hypothetical protein